ncbi:hypothetical protein [Methylobacillus glycogenes]|uniref:hypothetical protein n=1 Tax=Methylobacillus glycogenes TaxID=406 RepID=UPI0004706870|nr:hypothetical protein [Methylobacillus glycogenes]
MRFPSVLLACTLSLMSLHSVAKDESLLDLRYEAEISPNAKVVKSNGCELVIKAPEDVRLNKETLGITYADNAIISKQAPTLWLNQALLDLKRLGFKTAAADEGQNLAQQNVLSVQLDKAYVWFHSMNIYATLVVNTSLQNRQGAVVSKQYRVIGTKSNWANTDSEYTTTLNIAASRLLEQLSTDLAQQCKA